MQMLQPRQVVDVKQPFVRNGTILQQEELQTRKWLKTNQLVVCHFSPSEIDPNDATTKLGADEIDEPTG